MVSPMDISEIPETTTISPHLASGTAIRLSEPHDLAAWLALGDVILAIARDARDGKSLHERGAAAPVLIQDIIDGARVAFLEHVQVQDVLAHINLVGDLDDLELAVLIEDDDVVDIRAVANELVLLQACVLFPSLEEFSTVCCDPHSQRLWCSQ